MDQMLYTLLMPRTQAITALTLRNLLGAPRHDSGARLIQLLRRIWFPVERLTLVRWRERGMRK
jgi:hypothetical protein